MPNTQVTPVYFTSPVKLFYLQKKRVISRSFNVSDNDRVIFIPGQVDLKIPVAEIIRHAEKLRAKVKKPRANLSYKVVVSVVKVLSVVEVVSVVAHGRQ